MVFSTDRRKAAALVALVFVLGIAFGVVGVLAGRRVLGAGNRGAGGNGNGNGQNGQQIGQLTRELHLNADQEKQFRKVLSETRDRYDAIRDAMEPQVRQVRDQNRDKIRGILTAEQKPLFESFLERNRRNNRNDNNNNNNRRNDQNNRNGQTSNNGNANGNQNGNRNDQAPLLTRLTQELHLTADQETQLSGILRDTRTSLDALRQQMNPQFEEARELNREQLRQILSTEQRPILDAFYQRRDEERRRR